MRTTQKSFVPAAGFDWALPLYDPFTKLFRFDVRRARLIERAALAPEATVLDLGCGTGTLVVALKRSEPTARVSGVDPDPKALALARRKADEAQVAVQLEQGRADALPFADGSFDHVFSSYVLHHLESDEKRAALREVRRVLRPGGLFHLLDFEDERGHKSLLMRTLHAAHAKLHGNIESGLDERLREAGFALERSERERLFLFGAVGYYRARRPL